MVIENYSEKHHYETLVSWWKGHKWNAPPVDFLSKTGAVASSRNGFHAAGFLWQDPENSFAIMDMLVTDPKNKPQISAIALKEVIESLKRETDAKYIMTMCRQKSLVKFLCMVGDFKESDSDVTHLICVR